MGWSGAAMWWWSNGLELYSFWNTAAGFSHGEAKQFDLMPASWEGKDRS